MLTAFTTFRISVSDFGTDGQDILLYFKFIYGLSLKCQREINNVPVGPTL